MAESALLLEHFGRLELSSLGTTVASAVQAKIGDPRTWNSTVYIALVGLSLAARALVRSALLAARIMRELLLLLPAIFLYFLVRGAVETRGEAAFDHAEHIIAVERALGIFREAELQAAITPYDAVVDLANWIYIWGHWPFVAAVAIWLYLRHGEAYFVFRNAFLVSGAIGLVIFSLYPVAPPRFLHELGFVDTVTLQSRSYRVLQPPALVNPYAAMPSLHFGWDLLFTIAIVRHSAVRVARLAGLLMPAAMFLSIVVTANHFFLDGIAGGLVAMAGLAAAVVMAGCGQTEGVEARSGQRESQWAGGQREPVLVE